VEKESWVSMPILKVGKKGRRVDGWSVTIRLDSKKKGEKEKNSMRLMLPIYSNSKERKEKEKGV